MPRKFMNTKYSINERRLYSIHREHFLFFAGQKIKSAPAHSGSFFKLLDFLDFSGLAGKSAEIIELSPSYLALSYNGDG